MITITIGIFTPGRNSKQGQDPAARRSRKRDLGGGIQEDMSSSGMQTRNADPHQLGATVLFGLVHTLGLHRGPLHLLGLVHTLGLHSTVDPH